MTLCFLVSVRVVSKKFHDGDSRLLRNVGNRSSNGPVGLYREIVLLNIPVFGCNSRFQHTAPHIHAAAADAGTAG